MRSSTLQTSRIVANTTTTAHAFLQWRRRRVRDKYHLPGSGKVSDGAYDGAHVAAWELWGARAHTSTLNALLETPRRPHENFPTRSKIRAENQMPIHTDDDQTTTVVRPPPDPIDLPDASPDASAAHSPPLPAPPHPPPPRTPMRRSASWSVALRRLWMPDAVTTDSHLEKEISHVQKGKTTRARARTHHQRESRAPPVPLSAGGSTFSSLPSPARFIPPSMLFPTRGWWEDPANPLHHSRSGLMEDLTVALDTRITRFFVTLRRLLYGLMRLSNFSESESRSSPSSSTPAPNHMRDQPASVSSLVPGTLLRRNGRSRRRLVLDSRTSDGSDEDLDLAPDDSDTDLELLASSTVDLVSVSTRAPPTWTTIGGRTRTTTTRHHRSRRAGSDRSKSSRRSLSRSRVESVSATTSNTMQRTPRGRLSLTRSRSALPLRPPRPMDDELETPLSPYRVEVSGAVRTLGDEEILRPALEPSEIPVPRATTTITTTSKSHLPVPAPVPVRPPPSSLPSRASFPDFSHGDHRDHHFETDGVWIFDAGEGGGLRFGSPRRGPSAARPAIRQAGYPYELIEVVTSDGYVVSLERLPRRGATKVAFFLHGIMDTAVGWVANGPQGSMAFQAYDRGFDVFLGNTRSNPPDVHTALPPGSGRYWEYNVNHLALDDMDAMLRCVHRLKCDEGAQTPPLSLAKEKEKGKAVSASVSGFATASPAPSPGLMVERFPRRRSISTSEAVPKTPKHQHQHQHQVVRRLVRTRFALSSAGSQHERDDHMDQAAWMDEFEQEDSYQEEDDDGELDDGDKVDAEDVDHREDRDGSSMKSGDLRLSLEQALWRCAVAAHLVGTWVTWHAAARAGIPGAMARWEAADLPPHLLDGPLIEMEVEVEDDNKSTIPSVVTTMSPTPLPRVPSDTILPRVPSSAALGFGTIPRVPSGQLRSRSVEPDGFGVDRGLEATPGSRRGDHHPRDRHRPAESDHVERRRSVWREDVRGPRIGTIRGRSPFRTTTTTMGTRDDGHDGLDFLDRDYARGACVKDWAPYRLAVVGHSLGGMVSLMHGVLRRLQDEPVHVHKLVLLSPAGFHTRLTGGAWLGYQVSRLAVGLVRAGGFSTRRGLRLPSGFIRHAVFKLALDIHRMPAMRDLLRALAGWFTGNDDSDWDRALFLPHFGGGDGGMPAVSWPTLQHFVQLGTSGKFQAFDYGAEGNRQRYGQAQPLDIAAHYGALRNVSVDLIAGSRDGVIRSDHVQLHVEALRAAGVKCTSTELDLAHLDFTFGLKREAQECVMRRLEGKWETSWCEDARE